MKRSSLRSMFTVSVLSVIWVAPGPNPAFGQSPVVNPFTAACGPQPANYVVTHEAGSSAAVRVPADKAMVYVIEQMPDYPFITKKVNVGLDGAWIGATDAQSYISFTIDPGVHHMCAVYQGKAAGMDSEGHILLLHLKAEAGKTYYVRYHAFFSKETPGIAFFELVDEDEGQLLLQRSEHATSVLKK